MKNPLPNEAAHGTAAKRAPRIRDLVIYFLRLGTLGFGGPVALCGLMEKELVQDLPTGDHRRGLGDSRPAYVLPLLAQKSWAKWTLYGNAGYWWQTAAGTRDYWYSGAVLEREINERLSLGAELFGNTPKERGGRADVAFNVGGKWKLSRHLNMLFAAGRDIVGDTRAMIYLGLQFLTK